MLSKSLAITGIFCLLANVAEAQSGPQCIGQDSASAKNLVLVQNTAPEVEIQRGPLDMDYVGGYGTLTLGSDSFHQIQYKISVSADRGWFGNKVEQETLRFKNFECRKPSDLDGTYTWDKKAQAFRNEKDVLVQTLRDDSGLAQVHKFKVRLSTAGDMVTSATMELYPQLVMMPNYSTHPGAITKDSPKLLRGLGPTNEQKQNLMNLPTEKAIEVLLNALNGNEDTRSAMLLSQLFDTLSLNHELEMRRSFESMDKRKARAVNLLVFMSLFPNSYEDQTQARLAAGRVLTKIMNPQSSPRILEATFNYLDVEKGPTLIQLNNALYLVLIMEKEVDLKTPDFQLASRLVALIKDKLVEAEKGTQRAMEERGIPHTLDGYRAYMAQKERLDKIQTLIIEASSLLTRI